MAIFTVIFLFFFKLKQTTTRREKQEFLNNYLVQLGYSSAAVMCWSFVILFFIKQGITIREILIYFFLVFLSAYITTHFMKNMQVTKTMRVALIFRILSFLFIIIFINKLQIYLTAITFGIFIPLFWVNQKISFFGYGKSHNIARISVIF